MGTAKKPSAYHLISADLRKKIFSGELKPGEALPSESRLCAQYGVARETVRKGLRELDKEGLIVTRPKVGCYVARPNYTNFRLGFPEEFQNCRSSYQKVAILPADSRIATELSVEEGAQVISLQLVFRDANENPIAVSAQFYPYERGNPSLERAMLYAVIPDAAISKISSYQVFSRIEVSAVNADEKTANALSCSIGEALLQLNRTYFDQDRRVIAYEIQRCRKPFGVLRGSVGLERLESVENNIQ